MGLHQRGKPVPLPAGDVEKPFKMFLYKVLLGLVDVDDLFEV
jgi:hypothetical protein